ncbi:hypothetical protein [Nocardia beijingensis]
MTEWSRSMGHRMRGYVRHLDHLIDIGFLPRPASAPRSIAAHTRLSGP